MLSVHHPKLVQLLFAVRAVGSELFLSIGAEKKLHKKTMFVTLDYLNHFI